MDTARKRAAALASSLGIFSYPNEKNMIKESLKQKPKHLLHVFYFLLGWGVFFSAAVSFVVVVVVIVEGVINVVWVYFCLDHQLAYFATARREKPANPEFFVYEQ